MPSLGVRRPSPTSLPPFGGFGASYIFLARQKHLTTLSTMGLTPFFGRTYFYQMVLYGHGLRTTHEGINQKSLKIRADVADKICFGHTQKFGSES